MVQTMTETASLQLQLDALNAAVQGNVLSVRYGNGEQIIYRSAEDLQQAITYVTRRLNERRRVDAGQSRHGISAARFTTP